MAAFSTSHLCLKAACGVWTPSVSQLAGSPVLPVEPGLCAACQHASVKGTNKGTAYLRCTRAAWDPLLVRYPRLPVRDCPGFDDEKAAELPRA
jgi:hypothetical protein